MECSTPSCSRNIHNSFTNTLHQQANGQLERYNSTIFVALRTHVADQTRDWDQFSNALTYAYNFQPRTSTSIAQCKLVLSKTAGRLTIHPSRTDQEELANFKKKWNFSLKRLIADISKRFDTARQCYKQTYDARLRLQTKNFKRTLRISPQ